MSSTPSVSGATPASSCASPTPAPILGVAPVPGTAPIPVTNPKTSAPNVAMIAAPSGHTFYRPMKLPWDINEFDGSNPTAYLRKYNLMAADCGLVGRAKLDRFSTYCAISIISEVESLNGYDNDDWNTFEASLKRYYFDKDPQQKEYQIPYLRSRGLCLYLHAVGPGNFWWSQWAYQMLTETGGRGGGFRYVWFPSAAALGL